MTAPEKLTLEPNEPTKTESERTHAHGGVQGDGRCPTAFG